MSEEISTSNRWTREELESLRISCQMMSAKKTKGAYWQSVCDHHKLYGGPERVMLSVRQQAMQIGVKAKTDKHRSRGALQRLYDTLGDTLTGVANKYGVTPSYLAHCRTRGKLPTRLCYKMLDDAMSTSEEWSERDARELQGLYLDA